MKTSTVLLALAAILSNAYAFSPHDNTLLARHPHVPRQAPENQPALVRRCARRPTVPQSNLAAGSVTVTPSSGAPAPTTPAPNPGPGTAGGGGGGTITNVDGSCGPSGATSQVTATSGPNGNIFWLNCGIDSGGWRPPYLSVSQLVVSDLGQALNNPNSPFHNCAPFIGRFIQYGNEFGIPAILLASFAMQESSCRPDAVGGGGEQGLMQITVEKCGGAPGGNCRDPDFNIRTGAQYFAQTLQECGGNVILAIGRYNGWHPGLTHGEATAAAFSACCRCQNNLDYLHQFLNGWCQNVDASRIGVYFNLAQCP